MSNNRVADLLVDTLVAAGVKQIYGLAGDSLNGITDSIRTRDNIRWIPIQLDQMVGFSLYMIRAVLNGRSDEVLDLARSNLFR
jgi:hypothetical protein